MAENSANAESAPNTAEENVQQPAEVSEEPVKQMKSVILKGFGGIQQAQVKNVAQVQPKEGEVLIRVKACGMNFNDLMVRQGVMENLPKTPFVLGFECSGEVEALGENVDTFAPGDRVVGICDLSAWAELVCIPAQYVYHMPGGMSFQDGAALLVNYLTAHLLLFDIGNLTNGQSVLVHSAGGGVGHAVCQLCRTLENVTVFGTASYGKHEDIKNNLDHLYDHVVDYCQEVRKISPEGVDVVLDSLCGEDTNRGISLLKPLGRYILYGSSNIVTGETKSFFSFAKSKAFQFGQHLPEKMNATKWWQVDKISPIKLFDENKSVSGFSLRTLLFRQGRHDQARDIVHKLFQMYNDGKIRPKIDSAWAFEDVGDAMQKMHDRKNIGKVILDPSLPAKNKSSEAEAQNTETPANGENSKQ